jgi:hypothetical protein
MPQNVRTPRAIVHLKRTANTAANTAKKPRNRMSWKSGVAASTLIVKAIVRRPRKIGTENLSACDASALCELHGRPTRCDL